MDHTTPPETDINSFLLKVSKQLRHTDHGKISLYDILRMLGIHHNDKKRITIYKSTNRNHAVEMCIPTHRWDPELKKSIPLKTKKQTPCADVEHTLRFMSYCVHRSSYPHQQTEEITEKFEHIHKSEITPLTEKEIVRQIRSALPWMCCPQFAIGPYRIDMYIPRFKIAVECDEFDHVQYNKIDEETRQNFISYQLGCSWVRFDPYTENFSVLNVVREILKLSQKEEEFTNREPNIKLD